KPRPAEPVPLGLGASDPGYHPLPNQAALELGDRRQDVEEKAPCRRRAVQHLIQDNELDSQCFKLASKGEQMPGRSSEPVELHASDDIYPAGPDGSQERIESGSALLGSRDAVIDVLGGPPTARCGEGVERLELRHGRLVARADPRV